MIAGANAKLDGLVHNVVASSWRAELNAGKAATVVTNLSESEISVVVLISVGVVEAIDRPIKDTSRDMVHRIEIYLRVFRITCGC